MFDPPLLYFTILIIIITFISIRAYRHLPGENLPPYQNPVILAIILFFIISTISTSISQHIITIIIITITLITTLHLKEAINASPLPIVTTRASEGSIILILSTVRLLYISVFSGCWKNRRPM